MAPEIPVSSPEELSDAEMMRYNRQIVLRGFDFDGQESSKRHMR